MSQKKCPLFVRTKRNKTGTISVQVIDKSSGRYKVVKTIGCSADPHAINQLYQQGLDYIDKCLGQRGLEFTPESDQMFYRQVINSITAHKLIGPELILNSIFNHIGFNQIEDELFMHLVISRLTYPRSKLKTVEYLKRYFGVNYDVYKVYRYMDELHNNYQNLIEQISYQHSKQVLGGNISIVFYDVTTIYFEAEKEDELRITGFSKDGKHQNPQIVLGLLVSMEGYPMAYQIYEGNKFEGHTLIPVLDAFRETYQLNNLIVVADAGLMSKDNVEDICKRGFQYILGARLKSLNEQLCHDILNLSLEDGQEQAIKVDDQTRLIISYSSKRARKDAYNRNRGLKKLERALASGKLTKKHINNRGYNKYLAISGEVNVHIDYEKFHHDAKWDGLKGYMTNTKLKVTDVVGHYKHLWSIEKAFRISKTDLRIRPVYHRLNQRIKAHITISFCAYKVYKELERQLKQRNANQSAARVIEVLNSIFAIEIRLPNSQQTTLVPIITDNEQREILAIFEMDI